MSGCKLIAPSSTYSVGLAASFDDPPRSTMSGQELLETMITITEQPGSMLLVYTKE